MGLWSRLKKTLRGGGRHNAEIQEELEFHLAMDVARGETPRDARIRLGNLTRVEEETRAAGIVEWIDSAWQDARYGLRQLRKTPALSLAVVLSLAIGVGANTAIFSLVDAALLKPLPVEDPESLRILRWTHDEFPAGVENINGDFSPIAGGRFRGSSISAALYRNLAGQQQAYAGLVGVADSVPGSVAVGAFAAEQVSVEYVSANFFQGLGVRLPRGRGFRADDDRVGAAPAVVVSERFWRQQLGAKPDALESSIRINHIPVQILGVAPAGFFGVRAGEWIDVYAPLAARVALNPAGGTGPRGEDGHDWWVRMIARLKPELPEAAARTQTAYLFHNLAAEATGTDAQKTPELVSSPGRRGFGGLNSTESSALWILSLLVGVLLLLVCANVANLLLARSVDRQRESAVRLALGAARGRLFRQHFIESGILSLLGGAAGLALGYILARSIHLLFETGRGAGSAFDLHISLRVLAYASGLSAIAAFLFGLAPALGAARVNLQHVLKAQTRSVTGRMRLPKILVCVQIALCLTALVAAGLLGRSLGNLESVEVGFDRAKLAYASVNPRQAGYSQERIPEYMQRLQEELARIPGVVSVSPTEVRLLSGNGNFSRAVVPGRPVKIERGVVSAADSVTRNHVGDRFFETMRIPLVAGRTFELRDMQPKSSAVVVDQLFAERFFPNQNPIGRRFGFSVQDPASRVIVGVVRNTHYSSLRTETPNLFDPLVPAEFRGTPHFAIRTNTDASRFAEPVRRAVASVDPAVPLIAFRTHDDLINGLLRTERLLSFVSAAFGVVALALAAIGLGGLLAYAVARRTNEIGVRMALGAAAGDVIAMVLRDSVWTVAAGIALGLPCAYAVGRLLQKSLFHLQPADPLTGVLAFAALLAVALLAAWIPARRAASIEPVIALRQD